MNEVKWIEVNRGKMSEWMDLMRSTLWNGPMVSWECPYQNDLNEPYEKVPIKMNGIDEKWMNWSE